MTSTQWQLRDDKNLAIWKEKKEQGKQKDGHRSSLEVFNG